MTKRIKLWKSFLSLILSIMMIITISLSASAKDTNSPYMDQEAAALESIYFCKDLNEYGLDGDLVMRVLTVSNHIFFTEDETSLRTDLSDAELYDQYGFSKNQVVDFHAILDGTYQPPTPIVPMPSTRAAARFYLSYQDLTAGVFAVLGTAAAAGPAALMAAWTSVSTALAGPLGTIAGISTAVLGSVFFADLAVKITGAIVQGKGVAFYLDWGIPPVKTAIE